MFTQIAEFAANHLLLVAAFVALLGVIFFNEFKHASKRYVNLSPAGAIQLINNDEVVLLDVREPAETAAGKIAKAIQIPLSSISKRISELEKHREKPIIVYCKTGSRSGLAASTLDKAGFTKVYSLSGGIMAWQDAHLPVVKK